MRVKGTDSDSGVVIVDSLPYGTQGLVRGADSKTALPYAMCGGAPLNPCSTRSRSAGAIG